MTINTTFRPPHTVSADVKRSNTLGVPVAGVGSVVGARLPRSAMSDTVEQTHIVSEAFSRPIPYIGGLELSGDSAGFLELSGDVSGNLKLGGLT